ncbi:MAG: hypothetical protein ACKO26_15900 [Planctomycetota bacterium]
MTDPNNFGFDSLLQDLGVPVEIHRNPTVADEPADPEPVAVPSVTESVTITTEEAAAAVIESAESEAPREDRKRRRRRRRRGQDDGSPEGTEGEVLDREDDSTSTAVAETGGSEDEEEEPFEVEDLTNLQFPSWDELIGSLYKPHH